MTWTTVGSQSISMSSTMYVGLAVTSHVDGVVADATFEQTTVGGAETATPPPSTGTTLRLLHWNTHHGGIGSDGEYDPARIATWIAKMNPHVASLNESTTSRRSMRS
jgi:hypothetical protein